MAKRSHPKGPCQSGDCQRAYCAGYRLGYEEGYDDGFKAGQATADGQ